MALSFLQMRITLAAQKETIAMKLKMTNTPATARREKQKLKMKCFEVKPARRSQPQLTQKTVFGKIAMTCREWVSHRFPATTRWPYRVKLRELHSQWNKTRVDGVLRARDKWRWKWHSFSPRWTSIAQTIWNFFFVADFAHHSICMQICQTVELWHHLGCCASLVLGDLQKKAQQSRVCVDRLDRQSNDLPILGSFHFHWFCEFVPTESHRWEMSMSVNCLMVFHFPPFGWMFCARWTLTWKHNHLH